MQEVVREVASIVANAAPQYCGVVRVQREFQLLSEARQGMLCQRGWPAVMAKGIPPCKGEGFAWQSEVGGCRIGWTWHIAGSGHPSQLTIPSSPRRRLLQNSVLERFCFRHI